MLLGIVKKNAIMMLDFALEAQKNDPSLDPLAAITQGCHVRFRPIMMTTVAALMGALPIAVGIGAGPMPAVRWVWLWWAGCAFRSWSRSTSRQCTTIIWKNSPAGWDASGADVSSRTGRNMRRKGKPFLLRTDPALENL